MKQIPLTHSCPLHQRSLFVVQTILANSISQRGSAKARTAEEEYQALLSFLKLNSVWGRVYPEVIKEISITREKLCIFQELQESLKEGTDDQKITKYSGILNREKSIEILSKHRDFASEKIEAHKGLCAILAILTGVGIVIAAGYFIYKAMSTTFSYGIVDLFSADSKVAKDAANDIIAESRNSHAAAAMRT